MRKNLSSRSRLLAMTAAIAGSLALVLPAIADGIKAGEAIKNKATATYSDGTTIYNATSNTVEIKVAEVAGVTVVATDPTTPTANSGETRDVIFTISNKGNDATQFSIPNPVISNTTDFVIFGTPTIVSVNGAATSIPLQPGIATGTYVPNGSLLPAEGTAGIGTVQVKVTIQVKPNATVGGTTTVSLGDTTVLNDQNVPQAGTIANDVRTVDNADGAPGESAVNGPPVNGVHEAMATSGVLTVGARPQAFATVLESVSGYTNSGTSSPYTDDKLTFAIAVKAATPPTLPAGLTVTDLNSTSIKLDTGTQDRILIANAIPAGTTLSTVNPTPAAGWTVVYSVSDLTTTDPLTAEWTTLRPTSGTITRIGFVKTGILTNDAPATTGFSFEVVPNASFAGGPIASIAQVFGQSGPGPVLPGTPTQIVYDESGDNASNNGLDGIDPNPVTNPTVPTGTGITKGIADPNDPDPTGGISADPTTKNTGTTSGGESTVFTIAGGLTNGPKGEPDAVGPTNSNNDDFTNKSVVLPVGLDPAEPLTDAQTLDVVFENTVKNGSPVAQVITLMPDNPPANTIPNGTTVMIDPDGPGPGTPVTFTLTGGVYTLPTGIFPPTVSVAGNSTVPYTVTVNLGGPADQLKEYPVVITAFVDTDGDRTPDTDEASNKTIDRVYTGYLKLLKEAQILDGATVLVPFTSDSDLLNPALRPGRIIEYRITYTNISSTATAGSKSVTLPANSLTITEDGTAAPNTWFATTKDPVGTTNPGSASDITAGASISTIVNGTDIQTYVDTVPTVAPLGTGSFLFRRQVK
jgi:hypothetical protein